MKIRNLLFILIFPLLTACNLSFAQDVSPPPGTISSGSLPTFEEVFNDFPLETPDQDKGQLIYQEKCIDCHGPSGLGDGPDSFELSVTVAPIGTKDFALHSSPAKWIEMIAFGNIENFMPPFNGSLDVQDQWDVLSYVYHLAIPNDLIKSGEILFNESCVECHGPDESLALESPNLSDISEVSFLAAEEFEEIVFEDDVHEYENLDILIAELPELLGYIRSLSIPNRKSDEVVEAIVPTNAEKFPNQVGEVTGIITNNSGDNNPDDLTITLSGYDQFIQVYNETTEYEVSGQYAFTDVPLVEGFVYFTTVSYSNINLSSEFIIVEADTQSLEIDTEIFSVDTDTSSLLINELMMQIEFLDAETVQIINWVTITNPTTFAITNNEETDPVAKFVLPSGATNLEFQTGKLALPLVLTKNGFGDTTSIMPGESSYELVYAYQLPFENEAEFNLIFEYPIENIFAFFPPTDIAVTSNKLTYFGEENINEKDFSIYSADSIGAGEPFTLGMNGKNPYSPTGFSLSNESNSTMIGAVSLVAVFFALYQTSKKPTTNITSQSNKKLMRKVILLDHKYKQEKISEEDYLIQRNELLNKFVGGKRDN
jgi:mono/diheme cytochrome c family protein